MQIRTSEVFDYVKKLEKAIGSLQGEVATLKQLVVSSGLTVTTGGALVSAGDIDVTTGNVNIDAGDLNVTTGGATIGGVLDVTGTITSDGGLQTFGANDSGGAGFRQVLVPNV